MRRYAREAQKTGEAQGANQGYFQNVPSYKNVAAALQYLLAARRVLSLVFVMFSSMGVAQCS
jgi:hypothetical protein